MLESPAGFLFHLERWRQRWGQVQNHSWWIFLGSWCAMATSGWLAIDLDRMSEWLCSPSLLWAGLFWRNVVEEFQQGSPSGLAHDSTALTDESCENLLWLVKYHVILISPGILYPFSWYLVFIIFPVELSFIFCCLFVSLWGWLIAILVRTLQQNCVEFFLLQLSPIAANFPLFSLTCSLMKRNFYDFETIESFGGNGVWPQCHQSCYLLLAEIIALLMSCWKTATLYGSKITKEMKK